MEVLEVFRVNGGTEKVQPASVRVLVSGEKVGGEPAAAREPLSGAVQPVGSAFDPRLVRLNASGQFQNEHLRGAAQRFQTGVLEIVIARQTGLGINGRRAPAFVKLLQAQMQRAAYHIERDRDENCRDGHESKPSGANVSFRSERSGTAAIRGDNPACITPAL
ncbi:MAG: hypothetical protein GYA76_13465 [Verrucomicrobia bacterium]|nr:hypothetical protein [Verrucomicrobiota bacterium]